ncbi:hypothetical protein HQ520_18865 [bacterium]|nr:hypothetical protein [bacterium]
MIGQNDLLVLLLFVTPTIGALCCLAGIIWLLVDRNRVRGAAFHQWQTYLENVAQSLENLRALRQILHKARQKGFPADTASVCDRLDTIFRTEIEKLDAQLQCVIQARDYLYSTISIDWRSFPLFASELDHLLQGSRPIPGAETALRPGSSKIEEVLRSNIDRLKSRNSNMSLTLQQLSSQVVDIAVRWRQHARRVNETPPQMASEETVAARFMASLKGGLPLEAIEGNLFETEAAIELLRERSRSEGLRHTERERIEQRVIWLQQTRRWWHVQRRLANQENLLREVSDNTSEIADTRYRERLDKWLNLHRSQEEKEDLQNQVGQLQVQNRMLGRQMQAFASEHKSLLVLEKVVRDTEGLRKTSQKDLVSLENVIEHLARSFAHPGVEIREIRALETKLSQSDAERRHKEQSLEALQLKLSETQTLLTDEREQFKATVQLLENALEGATEDKRSIQENMRRLEESYQELNQALRVTR